MTPLIVALTSHLLAEPPPISPALWRLLRPLVSAGTDAATLAQWATKNLVPVDAAKVVARLELAEWAPVELAMLGEYGIEVVTELQPEYPAQWKEKLAGKYPPLVFAAGELRVLSSPLIGIVGSREIDDDGSAFACEVAQQAVAAGYGVVSGGARGVDQVAMKAAFDAGGDSLGLLADSLLKATIQPSTVQALASGRVCLATPNAPNSGFTVGTAMGRNKLIYASSSATVVVAASEGKGGTWAGAVEAIESGLSLVLVRDIDIPGNQKLIAKGGAPINSVSDLESLIASSAGGPRTLFT